MRQPGALRFCKRVRIATAQLPKNLQQQHSATSLETSNADSSTKELAARTA